MEKQTETRPKNVWESVEKMTEILAKKGIAKEKGNTTDIKYNFRGIDDIRNHTAPHMKECALIITPRVTSRAEKERTTSKGSFALWVVLKVEFDLINTQDGSKITVPVEAEAVDYSDKATQKALSQAYKVFAINTFNIPTEGEQDSDAEKIGIMAMRLGVFESDELRRLWVANCKDAFGKQESALALKECESFYHEKLILMGASKDAEDVSAAAELRDLYASRLATLSKPVKGGL